MALLYDEHPGEGRKEGFLLYGHRFWLIVRHGALQKLRGQEFQVLIPKKVPPQPKIYLYIAYITTICLEPAHKPHILCCFPHSNIHRITDTPHVLVWLRLASGGLWAGSKTINEWWCAINSFLAYTHSWCKCNKTRNH